MNRFLGQDAAGRLTRQIVSPTTGHQYSYDNLGRLRADSTIAISAPPCDPHNPPIDPNGATCAFNASWAVTGGTGFSYDSAGNRRDLGGTYSAGNRITNFNGCSYATDLDGNDTSRTCGSQRVRFVWTAESRLDSLIIVDGQATTFDYNAAGRLVRKTTAGVVRHFLWQGDNPLAELDGAGTTKVAEYSYYPGLDHLHALIVGTTKYYAHADGLGNVIALTDQSQQLKRWYQYDAWGQDQGGSDLGGFAGADRARFKGALWLGQLDPYYMRNRWYEPQTGRFLSEDPIGLAGGMNPYAFSGNDPIDGRDPTGAFPAIIEGVLMECYELDFGAKGYSLVCGPYDFATIEGTADWIEPSGQLDSPKVDARGAWGTGGMFCVGGLGCGTPTTTKTTPMSPRAERVMACAGSALAFGANSVATLYIVFGTGAIGVGMLEAEMGGIMWGLTGEAASWASVDALIARGGISLAEGTYRDIFRGYAIGIVGDALGGDLNFNALVPGLGLRNAYYAVANNCSEE